MAPQPSRAALRRVVAAALRRGLPPADAEDLAAHAYERAATRFRADRGSFDAYYERVAASRIQEWWREHRRRRETALGEPTARAAASRLEEVHANQQRLIDALDDDERRVFTVWAAQKHLPQGVLTAPRAAARLGLSVSAFNNAKRRLATRVRNLAEAWGLTPRDFFSCEDREGPRRRSHAS